MPSGLKPRLLAAAFSILIALVVLPAAASAAPPSNDDFANPLTLTVGDAISGTNVDATSQADEPNPEGNNGSPYTIYITENDCTTLTEAPKCGNSVWYSFQAPETTNYTIATCDRGTDFDSVLGVYTGDTIGAATQVGANDDGDGVCQGGDSEVGSSVAFDATAGTTYHVQVAGYGADQGSFYLHANPTAAPPPPAAPDTQIATLHSVAGAQLNAYAYTKSGPRQTPSFDFYSDEDGATFECSLDGAAFSHCVSPVSYDDLSGSHQFAVRAVVAGVPDPTPAIERFSVDNQGPDTSLLGGASGSTSNSSIDWGFAGSERSFEVDIRCKLDGQPPLTSSYCGNTGGTTTNPLCNGPHEMQAAEVDLAYNIDPTPLVRDFTETGGSACAPPTLTAPVDYPPEDSATSQLYFLGGDLNGQGGTLSVQYGTTTAYGESLADQGVGPGILNGSATFRYLQPGTEYHWKATVTSPAGSADTGDLTFTTPAASGDVPDVSVGTPVVTGHYAAAIPLTIDLKGASGTYGVLVDSSGPARDGSPVLYAEDQLTASGPQSRTLDLIDLKPGTTYHVRGFAQGAQYALSPSDVTFTVPPLPVKVTPPVTPPPAQPPVKTPPFKFKRSSVRLGRLTRHSKFVTLTIKNLPPSSSVGLTLNARVHSAALKQLAKGHAKANKNGVARLKVKLSKNARKLFRNRHVKSLSLKITVTPKGQRATHLTLHPKLRR
jgi:hypothetical protein